MMNTEGKGQPVVPPRPSFLENEDEAIQKAKALSLQTAKEDELRRRRLYGSSETIPGSAAGRLTPQPVSEVLHASSSYPNLTDEGPLAPLSGSRSPKMPHSSLIARPRPQPRQAMKDAPGVGIQLSAPPKSVKPVVPPRPKTAPESPNLRPRPIRDFIDAKIIGPPSSDYFAGILTPGNGLQSSTLPRGRAPIPVPQQQQPEIFPNSGGVLGLPPPDSIARKRRTPPIPSDDANHLAEKPLITLSPSMDIHNFDLTTLDPLHPGPSKSPSPTLTGIDTHRAKTEPQQNFNNLPTQPHGAGARSRDNKDYNAALEAVGKASSAAYHGVSHQEILAGYQKRESSSSPTGVTARTKSEPQPNYLNFNSAVAQQGPGAHFKDQKDYNTALEHSMANNPAYHAASHHEILAMFKNKEAAKNSEQRPSSESGSADGNLMDLSEPVYTSIESLTLESFDPLYAYDTPAEDHCESTDSIGLFPNPLDRLQRRNTPNPFPGIDPVTTQNILRQSGMGVEEAQAGGSASNYKPRLNVASVDAATTQAEKSPPREHRELLDPFSMSDLTFALERKRQNHAKEQEERIKLKEEQREKRLKQEEEKKEADRKSAAKLAPALQRRQSVVAKSQESSYETLLEFPETADEEIRAFCQMVARIKVMYGGNEDEETNPGVVISPRRKHPPFMNMTVKIVVKASFISDPGHTFTCDVNSLVEHMIGAVLLSKSDDLASISTDDYVLKVRGLSEYLLNKSILANYQYVQQCLKLDRDIIFELIELPKLKKPFKRSPEDSRNALFVPKPKEVEDKSMRVTRDKLNILMETFYKEVEKLRDQAIQNGLEKVQCRSVLQAVKAVCAVLQKIETIDIVKSMQRVRTVNLDKNVSPATPSNREAFVYLASDGAEPVLVGDCDNIRKVSDIDDLHIALEELTKAVKGLIELYCKTFHTDFRFESSNAPVKGIKEVTEVKENLIVHIATAHRIEAKIKNSYEEFKVITGLYYGGKKLAPEVTTQMRPTWMEGFQDTIIWDEWIQFESVIVCNLPREAKLCFSLVGVKQVQSGSDGIRHKVNVPLGWVAMQVFDHNFELSQGGQLLGLWQGHMSPIGTTISNTELPNSTLLQVNMPDFDCDVVFPAIPEPSPSMKQDFASLHPNDQELLQDILEKDSVTMLMREETEVIWEKRHYLYDKPEALPKVMQAMTSWWWGSLRESYSMIVEWASLQPEQALELLLPHHADTFVRTKSVEWLQDLGCDDLLHYLPQLVQALKFESYHTSALARMLLEKAIASVRLAHQLYWSLKEAADDIRYRKRYQLMFGALLSIVGERTRKEFSKQEDLIRMLSAIADKVKKAKDKDAVLQRELYNMWDFLQHSSVRLPIDPAMEVVGVDVKSCSYFTSFTFPLKLVMKNIDPKAEPLYIMFKAGDDLRQDMLTMQMVDIMDKLWLQENLDLKIVTFACTPTGIKRGLVEIITESDTLRKIQTKHGLAGSFKDRPIAEWLQMQNPTELEYQKAVENFTKSCAGYCVATYVLGICDRHNDNIMIKHSGNMFHIDFAKFLGDAQMFGNFKRDRVPFVLTSDMAYVINGGDKPSQKFQDFVDLCCQALNVIRRHGNLFINLFSLMVQSGIPGVNQDAARYVQKALMPDCTDVEVTAMFTRMINDSLKSTFTQINFFLHNLAQVKFHGHSEGALLSFIPKTYSLTLDGKIGHIEMYGFQKRYNPEKYYIYIIKVDRENQRVPAFIFRRYSEFQEFHHQLVATFPLVRLPRLSGKVIIGRTHVKTVAEMRKAELERFLKEVLTLASEISECDLVYTFCHPMLRDEQDIGKTNLQKLREPSPPKKPDQSIHGQLKMSLFYKSDSLTLMIMHVKDLTSVSTGAAPDPYVKVYLQPDPMKLTKRKTKIAKSTFHPTFNEMLIYRQPLDSLKDRTLQVTVWNYDALKENEFLGAIHLRLCDLDLSKETTGWYPLQTLHHVSLTS